MSTVSFLTARIWNSLPLECFPLIYDINGISLELTDIV